MTRQEAMQKARASRQVNNVLRQDEPPVVKETKKATSWHYQLKPNDPGLVPVDENGQKRAPYPPLWTAANSGTAINPKTGYEEEWRYLHTNQKTLWVSEQTGATRNQINSERNDIVFRRGHLTIPDSLPMKKAALEISDDFEGCVNPKHPERPKKYFLIDPEKEMKSQMAELDDAFEAEKHARALQNEELYAMAYRFGLNLDLDDATLKTQLIIKSKQHPKVFLRELVNPDTKSRFMFLMALQEGKISTDLLPGHIVWSDTQEVICEVSQNRDAVEQLTLMLKNNMTKVKMLYERLITELQD